MAERHRSKDGRRETDDYVDPEGTPSQQGRFQNLERKVGTRDETKRAEKDRPGATRATKSDEAGEGDLGGHHGTSGGRS